MPDLSHPVRAADLAEQWRPDWLSLVVLGGVVVLVVRARLRLRADGRGWPRSRDASLAAGVVLGVWVTCGFPQARGSQLMWVWTTQVLLLLLVVPVLLVAAQPLALARAAYGPRSGLARVLASGPMRVGGHPAVSPLYVPVLAGLLFFGGVGAWSLRWAPVGWALHVLLLLVGAVIALPLVDREDTRTSLAVGAALAVGVVELLLDAVPGIVLRLETHLTIPAFGLDRPPWAPSWLADQQTAGSILWTVAEVLDLPFLVLTVLQWIRVERTEARRVDLELDRAQLAPTGTDPDPTTPWWHHDPALRGRYGPP
ncbi:Cytochrome c oxidase assembly factor CtaG [Klenkia soli]|uniref:Cytochrome c oxidase assembly factor CtaG n=1 Tax=Klenkia soli TaxID=1052260 RepID=A0A1H0BNI4_9ACTN|nr:cytochrome c oxidase assembly protein [Klenkia soli]SDN47181.1 Cytochrome c oxidase assembly factor CtaG [Klenkia soli]